MTINLDSYGVIRPEKLRWVFPNNDQEILANVKSKSLRSFLRRSDELIKEAGIDISYLELAEVDFLNWLPYYREKMSENNYDLFANEAWYQNKIVENKQVFGIFAKHKGKLIGSVILTKMGKELATMNFKASERINMFSAKKSSLGAILDYYFLQKMKQEGFKTISAGVARNASGVINSFSYLEYKLGFGYYPTLMEDGLMLNDVPVNNEGNVIFYGLKNQKLIMYGLKPADSPFVFEQARFSSPEIPFIELTY